MKPVQYKDIKAGDLINSYRSDAHVVLKREADNIWIWNETYGMLKVPRRTFIRNWLRYEYYAFSPTDTDAIYKMQKDKVAFRRNAR